MISHAVVFGLMKGDAHMKQGLVVMVLISLGVAVSLWKRDASVCDDSKSQSVRLYGLDYTAAWLEELKKESAAMNVDAEKILAMRWNAWDVTVSCAERPLVQTFIDSIMADGRDLLTEEQLNLLHDSITDFVFYNATNDRRNYYAKLLGQGETINDLGRKWLSQAVLEGGKPDLLDADALTQLTGLAPAKCSWYGLVAEGTRIKVYSTESANLEEPGRALSEVVHRKTWRSKVTAPPVSFEEAVKIRGQVLMADLEVFVADGKREIAPYFCRFWFDDVYSVWRLECVISRPTEWGDYGEIMA
jgi:hypothetical protein